MRRRARAPRLFVVSIVAALVAAITAPGALAAPPANGFVSGPRAGDAAAIALEHLRTKANAYGLARADLADVVVADRYTDDHSGVTHLYLRQRVGGIQVADTDATVNVARDGSIVSVYSNMLPKLKERVRPGGVGRAAATAVKDAARQLGLPAPGRLVVKQQVGGKDRAVIFEKNRISLTVIPARLVYQPVGNELVLAWDVAIAETSGQHWWNARVDANTGKIVALYDWSAHADDAYNVFAIPAESPDETGRTIVTNPATEASPGGWHNTDADAAPEFTITRGNNVHAYPDRNNNNQADEPSPDGGAGLSFDFPLDLTAPPVDYQDAATANLFYVSNVIHDVLYTYGFDEKAGNFQVNNWSKNAGKGGDPVLAEAQDGSGRNNANFNTPPDGFSPVMQMFEWRSSAPNPILVNTGDLAGQTFFGPMAGFGDSLVTTGPITGDVVYVGRGCDPDYPVGNAPPIPDDPYLADPDGKIALIDRGTCTFVSKVKKAQDEGAIMAIVANNIAGAPFAMGGGDPTITIPSVMISLADGNTFKAELPFNVTISDGTGGAPDRDSDLDTVVIAHEYGHGVSNRLTGGPGNVNCLNNAEQMGEGWSDFLGVVLTARSSDVSTTNRSVATYLNFVDANGQGLRPTPYTTDMTVNPSTYQTVIDDAGTTLTIPHGVGYVWASMLWEVYWNLVDEHGFNPDIYDSWETGGNNLALQLVIDGMKFQRCGPGFVDGRNAILDADLALTGGDNQCLIWEGFAKRGLGFSAEQRSSKKTADGTAAFDLPAECGGGTVSAGAAAAAAALPGASRSGTGTNQR
ncbi:MAG TPA: M36 family metallopeptidase [Candidatus Limnocylindrales bacterium]|nr:M36 family metallopeptidase [Candidatus Limnocylindrales bacterium]